MQLDQEMSAFLNSGVSITVASCSPDLIPSVARAKGCHARAGTATLRIFLSTSQAEDLLRDVQSTRKISVTFSVPDTHRTVQFKGCDAHITPLQPEEARIIAAYIDIFHGRIATFGFSADFTRAFLGSPADEVAVEFSVTDAFLQTPGANAGSRL